MKKILLPSVVLFFTLFILANTQTSCKKESVRNLTDTVYKCTPSIKGLWIGSHQNSVGGQPFSMSIRANGTMSYEDSVYNKHQLCIGTWTLVNSKFECNTECIYGYFVGVKQKFTANFDPITGLLSNGQWVVTYPLSSYDSGTFTLTKVN